MKVAILGGGNGAYAAAADLTEQGHTCALWRRNAAALASLVERPIIRVLDHAGERDVTIAGAHADIGVAVADDDDLVDAIRGIRLLVRGLCYVAIEADPRQMDKTAEGEGEKGDEGPEVAKKGGLGHVEKTRAVLSAS